MVQAAVSDGFILIKLRHESFFFFTLFRRNEDHWNSTPYVDELKVIEGFVKK